MELWALWLRLWETVIGDLVGASPAEKNLTTVCLTAGHAITAADCHNQVRSLEDTRPHVHRGFAIIFIFNPTGSSPQSDTAQLNDRGASTWYHLGLGSPYRYPHSGTTIDGLLSARLVITFDYGMRQTPARARLGDE